MSFCLFYILIAALCASYSNWCIRKNVEKGGTATAYLFAYFIFSFGISIFIKPIIWTGNAVSPLIFSIGLIVGMLIGIMMILTALALKHGPSATTFAFQNSSCVMPSLILAILFGSSYGFALSPGIIFGAMLVVGGIFWTAAKQNERLRAKQKWYLFATGMFLMQVLILSLFQWRCLLHQPQLPIHFLIPFSCNPEEEAWFMPGLFIAAATLQGIYFYFTERRKMKKEELFWGALGRLGNGISTFFLLKATEMAMSNEKVIIFPFFAVLVILLCNLWGRYFYQERIVWKSNILCMSGILIASIF